jgi:dihydroneopterin aldolase
MPTTTKKVCGASVTSKQTGGKRKTKVGGNYGANLMKESEYCKPGFVKSKKSNKCVSVTSLKGRNIVITQNYNKLNERLPDLNTNLNLLSDKYDKKMEKLSELVKKALEKSHEENVQLKNKNDALKDTLNDKDKKAVEETLKLKDKTGGKRLTKQRGGIQIPNPLGDAKAKNTAEKIDNNNNLCKTNNEIITESLIELFHRIHDEFSDEQITKEKENYEGFSIDKRGAYIKELTGKQYKSKKHDTINEIRNYATIIETANDIKKKKILEDYFDFEVDKDGDMNTTTIPKVMRKIFFTNEDITFRVEAAMLDVSDVTNYRSESEKLAQSVTTGSRKLKNMAKKLIPGSKTEFKSEKININNT